MTSPQIPSPSSRGTTSSGRPDSGPDFERRLEAFLLIARRVQST